MSRLGVLTAAVGAAALVLGAVLTETEGACRCAPSRADALGPFYEPGAPIRSKVAPATSGAGRVLTVGCRPIARARIESWLVDPRGEYDDAHRATVMARLNGRYRFESNRPIAYESRLPHIHVRVSRRGFGTLVTQHYPRAGRRNAVFNLVLSGQ